MIRCIHIYETPQEPCSPRNQHHKQLTARDSLQGLSLLEGAHPEEKADTPTQALWPPQLKKLEAELFTLPQGIGIWGGKVMVPNGKRAWRSHNGNEWGKAKGNLVLRCFPYKALTKGVSPPLVK